MREAFGMYRTTALFGDGKRMTGRYSGAWIADGPINLIIRNHISAAHP
jgi:hypothetical protein